MSELWRPWRTLEAEALRRGHAAMRRGDVSAAAQALADWIDARAAQYAFGLIAREADDERRWEDEGGACGEPS